MKLVGAGRFQRFPVHDLWSLYSFGGSYTLQALYFFVLARGLGPTAFGEFAAALAAASVISPFVGFGSGHVMVVFGSRDPTQVYRRMVIAVMSIIGAAALLYPAFAAAALEIFRGRTAECCLILGVSELIFTRLFDVCQQVWQTKDEMRRVAHLNVSLSLLRLVVAVVLWQSGALTSIRWSVAYLAINAVVVASALGLIWRAGARGFLGRLTAEMFIRTWKVGIAFSVGMACKTVYVDSDKVVLSAKTTDATVGNYTAAYRLVSMLFIPVQALVFSRNTAMFRAGSLGAHETYRLVRRLLPRVVLLAVCGSALGFGASYLVKPALGPGFGETGEMLRYLCLMPVVQALHYLIGDSIMGLGRQGRRASLQLVTAVLNVGLNLILVPRIGWRGAVVATYAGEGLLVLLMLASLRSELSRADTSS